MASLPQVVVALAYAKVQSKHSLEQKTHRTRVELTNLVVRHLQAMDERRHGSLSPSRMSLQSLSEAGARQLQKQTSRSLLAAETRTVAASSSARVRLAVQITREIAP